MESAARLAYTSFGPPAPLIVKNVASDYLRSESSFFLAAGGFRGNAIGPILRPPPDRVIVLQPGSRWLKLGLAADAMPRFYPHVVARRLRNAPAGAVERPAAEELLDDPAFSAAVDASDADLRSRLFASKRKPVPHARQFCTQYNTSQQAAQPERLHEYNDPARVEWVDLSTARPDVLTGHHALNLPGAQSDYCLRWPIHRRALNSAAYASPQELQGDITALWTDAILSQLGISASQLPKYHVVLVIPDLFHRPSILSLVEVLHSLHFRAFMLVQESVSVSFGAGASTACIVDVGATATSIACVDDGLIVGSKLILPYGGDDVTRYIAELMLRRSLSPYTSMNPARFHWDWIVAEDIKERFASMNEADLNLQLVPFYRRTPARPTEKWTIKMYDELLEAPMCLFVERVLAFLKKLESRYSSSIPPSIPGTPHAAEQESSAPAASNSIHMNVDMPSQVSASSFQPPALDRAIHYVVSALPEDRMRRVYGYLILCGGGVRTIGFADHLAERLKALPGFKDQGLDRGLRILTGAKEIDPRALAWKGATIAARIECAGDMWCAREEWSAGGLRMLREKLTFQW